MTKKGIRINSTVVILLVIFLAIVFGGRFIFNNTLPKDDRIKTTTEGGATAGSDPTSSDESLQASQKSIADTPTPKTQSCAEQIQADLTAKKQSFAKGQILVTFAADITYIKAKDILSVYGLVVQNEVDSQASFKSRHLITAAVAPGQEIAKVCLLRSDSQVRFAGLDVYFGLHE